MQEYFRLLGLSCSKQLRKKLDCAFYIPEHPDEDRYALIKPEWDGDCPLHMVNGYCELHSKCGEKSLASICRLYPRSFKVEYAYECSCTNSCEKVLELLFAYSGKLTFEELLLEFEAPKLPKMCKDENKKNLYKIIREFSISILQDRKFSLVSRLECLGYFMRDISKVGGGNTCEIENIINRHKVDGYKNDKKEPEYAYSFPIQEQLAAWFENNNVSIETYGKEVEEYYSSPKAEGVDLYKQASEHFEQIFPDWEIMFEHMAVNHIFYEEFPFADKNKNYSDEYISLCGMYAFLRYISLGYMASREKISDFVDLCAAAFRIIEHSNFDKVVDIILRNQKCDTFEKLFLLLKA